MGIFKRFSRNASENSTKEPQSKLHQIIYNVAIFGTFISIGLFVLGLFKVINMTTFVFGLTATIALLSVGCLLILPWLKIYDKGKYKKVAIVFMCFIAVCTILWIICVYLGIDIYKKSKVDDVAQSSLLSTLKMIKITLIISLQFLLASTVASTIIKYQKQMIVFQVITYLSNLFFDVYVTCFLLCLTSTPEKGIEISKNIKFLFTKTALVFFLLSIIYMMLSSKIMQAVEARRFKTAVEDEYDITGTKRQINEKEPEKTPEERLEKLQEMLDKKIITQEEYEKKREDILKDL